MSRLYIVEAAGPHHPARDAGAVRAGAAGRARTSSWRSCRRSRSWRCGSPPTTSSATCWQRAVREQMTPGAIKKAVQQWRPDYHAHLAAASLSADAAHPSRSSPRALTERPTARRGRRACRPSRHRARQCGGLAAQPGAGAPGGGARRVRPLRDVARPAVGGAGDPGRGAPLVLRLRVGGRMPARRWRRRAGDVLPRSRPSRGMRRRTRGARRHGPRLRARARGRRDGCRMPPTRAPTRRSARPGSWIWWASSATTRSWPSRSTRARCPRPRARRGCRSGVYQSAAFMRASATST